jgi:hypothetical protein
VRHDGRAKTKKRCVEKSIAMRSIFEAALPKRPAIGPQINPEESFSRPTAIESISVPDRLKDDYSGFSVGYENR